MNLLMRLWGLWLLAAVTLAFAFLPAYADTPVYQTGTALTKHLPVFQSNGRLRDSGNQLGLPGGGIDSFAVVNATVAKPGCFYDVLPSAGPAHSLCFGPSGIAVQALGGASASTFAITVDGVTWGGGGTPGGSNGQIQYNNSSAFGGLTLGPALTTSGNILNVVAAGISNAMLANPSITLNSHSLALGGSLTLDFADLSGGVAVNRITAGTTNTLSAITAAFTNQVWASATVGSKTDNVPGCVGGLNGNHLTIVDAQNTAATYPITIQPASGTIGPNITGAGDTSYVLFSNGGSLVFQCDGNALRWQLVAGSPNGSGVRYAVGTSLTVSSTDNGGVIDQNNAGAVTATIAQAGTAGFPKAGYSTLIRNSGAGTITLTPTTSLINGGANITITGGNSGLLFADLVGNYEFVPFGGSAGSSVSVTASTPDIVVTPSPGTGTFTVGTTNPQNTPADGGSHSYTVLSSDITKEVVLASTFTTVPVPQATGSFGAGSCFVLTNKGAVTATSATSTINGIAGATGFKLGANSKSDWCSDGTNWLVAAGLPTDATQTSTNYIGGDNAVHALPAGGGVGVKISTQTGAASTYPFTTIGSHAYYVLRCSAILTSADADNLFLQVSEDNGATYKTTAYTTVVNQRTDLNTTFTGFNLTGEVGIRIAPASRTTGAGSSFTAEVSNLASTTQQKQFSAANARGFDGTNNSLWQLEGQYTTDNGAINAFQIIPASGTITGGTCTLYAYDS